jgi:hypothetical protein
MAYFTIVSPSRQKSSGILWPILRRVGFEAQPIKSVASFFGADIGGLKDVVGSG